MTLYNRLHNQLILISIHANVHFSYYSLLGCHSHPPIYITSIEKFKIMASPREVDLVIKWGPEFENKLNWI